MSDNTDSSLSPNAANSPRDTKGSISYKGLNRQRSNIPLEPSSFIKESVSQTDIDHEYFKRNSLPKKLSKPKKLEKTSTKEKKINPNIMDERLRSWREDSTLNREAVFVNGHSFSEHTYSSPVACKHCKQSIWRFEKQAYKIQGTARQLCHLWEIQRIAWKCKKCNSDVHLGCLESFKDDCELIRVTKSTINDPSYKRGRTRSIDDYTQIVRPVAGYRLEDGLSGGLLGSRELLAPVLMNETPWYSMYFLGKEHDHLIMDDKRYILDPFVVSVIREKKPYGLETEIPDDGAQDEEDEEEDEDDEEIEQIVDGEPDTDEKIKERAKREKEKKEKKEKKKTEKKLKKEKEKEKKKLEKKLKKLRKKSLSQEDSMFDEDEVTDIYRIVIWKKTGKEQWTIPVDDDEKFTSEEIANLLLPFKKMELKLIESSNQLFGGLTRELSLMEQEEFTQELKIGVLFTKKGQVEEDEFFGNIDSSPEFEKFLNIIGQKVKLKGFEGFRGGLDVDSDTTGEHSYYTEFEGNKIMFHVSTLLPYNPKDKQQVGRKRHIGNDIVCIVFQDSSGGCFSPKNVRSQMIHTFIAVSIEGSNEGIRRYRVNVTTRDTVAPFGPPLPDPPIFTSVEELRQYILAKAINAERIAILSPSFRQRRERTLNTHLNYVYTRYVTDVKKGKNTLRMKISDRKSRAFTFDESMAPPSPSEKNFYTVRGTNRFGIKSPKLFQFDTLSRPTIFDKKKDNKESLESQQMFRSESADLGKDKDNLSENSDASSESPQDKKQPNLISSSSSTSQNLSLLSIDFSKRHSEVPLDLLNTLIDVPQQKILPVQQRPQIKRRGSAPALFTSSISSELFTPHSAESLYTNPDVSYKEKLEELARLSISS